MIDTFTFQRRLFSFAVMFVLAVLSIALTAYALFSVYMMVQNIVVSEGDISVGKVLLFGVAMMPAYWTYLFVSCAKDDWVLLSAKRH
jgi:hypothetical protein